MNCGKTFRQSVLLVVLALAATPERVHAGKAKAHAAPGIDLSKYKTYQWLPTRVLRKTGLVENDPVLTPIIKNAVNRELKQLGLTEVSEGGDLQVATGITTHSVPSRGRVHARSRLLLRHACRYHGKIQSKRSADRQPHRR